DVCSSDLEQKGRGATVLLSSHQLAEIEKVCDRVVFLRGGVIARVETLRRTDNYEVAIRFLAGSFDAGAVERIAGRAPRGDTVVVSAASEADIAALVRRFIT